MSVAHQGGVDNRTGQVQSLLYVAFVKILRLLRLGRRDNEELAIKVVMLRHEVDVLRRQVVRPVLQPSGRALFAGLSRLLDRGRWERFCVQPETLLRWHRELARRRAGLGPMSTGPVAASPDVQIHRVESSSLERHSETLPLRRTGVRYTCSGAAVRSH